MFGRQLGVVIHVTVVTVFFVGLVVSMVSASADTHTETKASHTDRMREYRVDVLKQIRRNWKYQQGSENLCVFIRITPEGNLFNPKDAPLVSIVESTGDAVLDAEGIRAVQASKFGRLPHCWSNDYFSMEVSFADVLHPEKAKFSSHVPATADHPSLIVCGPGTIGPYRRDLMIRISQHWKPMDGDQNCIVSATITREGKLSASAIAQTSGNKKIDLRALETVRSTYFAPLPKWFNGPNLTFKIEMSKISELSR